MLTCEERIEASLADEIEELRLLYRAATDDLSEKERDAMVAEYGEHPEEAIYEHGLCFDYVLAGTFDGQDEGYFCYQISWGGPSDEFRFYTDAALHVHRVEYVFMDWGDGARRVLEGDNKQLLLDVWSLLFEDVAQYKLEEAERCPKVSQ